MRFNSLVLVGAAAFLLSGCPKSNEASDDAPRAKDLPKWFIAPPAGCSAGTYEFKGNLLAARDGANERARRELARNLEVMIQAMIKDYIEEGTAEGQEFSEELVSNVSKSIAQGTMNGTRPQDGAVDDDRYYALVCLDPETFSDALERQNELKGKMREALKARADTEFDDMADTLKELNAQSE